MRAVKGSRAPLALLPGLTLNDADGKPSAEAEAILRGGATLFDLILSRAPQDLCPETWPRPDFLEKTVKLLRPVLPRRFRGDIPVVPVVRLTGIIGFSTPLRPGLTLASVAKPLERAFA